MEVSEFKITKILPEELKSSLPYFEEIEKCSRNAERGGFDFAQ